MRLALAPGERPVMLPAWSTCSQPCRPDRPNLTEWTEYLGSTGDLVKILLGPDPRSHVSCKWLVCHSYELMT